MAKQLVQYLNLLDTCSNLNSKSAKEKSRTKQLGKQKFLENNIPTANSKVFINPIKALKFVEKYGYPVVVKPNFGGFSKGSYFPINNKKDLLKACFLTKLFWPKSIIETYLEGKNYRVVTAYNNIAAITQRTPPYIIGDNKSTIQQLIEKENIEKKKLNIPNLIVINNYTKKYLKKQNLTLESIPKKDEKIHTHYRVALAPGGEIINFKDDKISKKNKELCLKINKIFGADVFGIDIIMEKGIDIDYDKQKTIVLEVNSRAYLKMHTHPRYGEPIDLENKIQEFKNQLKRENN